MTFSGRLRAFLNRKDSKTLRNCHEMVRNAQKRSYKPSMKRLKNHVNASKTKESVCIYCDFLNLYYFLKIFKILD